MRKSLLILVITASASLSAATPQMDPYSATKEPAQEMGSVNKQASTDDQIANKVHDLISSEWFIKGGQEVTFHVNNGEVNLQGYVDSNATKKKVIDYIKKLPGVKKVNAQLTVREDKIAFKYYQVADNTPTTKNIAKSNPVDFAATDSDKELNNKIRDKLRSFWDSKGYDTFVLKTNNGIITISGYVDRYNDIQLINADLRAIDGVKAVNNQLVVKGKW